MGFPHVFSKGFCPTCCKNVEFIARGPWLRDQLKCSHCASVPRERALMAVILQHYPNWKGAVVHESSPAKRGASMRLSQECARYVPSQFWPDRKLGSVDENGVRCENLEAMTFADESIDLHVTQDVFEHIFHPEKAFAEIGRTLAPGGMHIFTTPLVNKGKSSEVWATLSESGEVHYLQKAEYHGNPISGKGSLVTMHWGYDICEVIQTSSGLSSRLVFIDDVHRGIRAEYIEVIVTVKPKK